MPPRQEHKKLQKQNGRRRRKIQPKPSACQRLSESKVMVLGMSSSSSIIPASRDQAPLLSFYSQQEKRESWPIGIAHGLGWPLLERKERSGEGAARTNMVDGGKRVVDIR